MHGIEKRFAELASTSPPQVNPNFSMPPQTHQPPHNSILLLQSFVQKFYDFFTIAATLHATSSSSPDSYDQVYGRCSRVQLESPCKQSLLWFSAVPRVSNTIMNTKMFGCGFAKGSSVPANSHAKKKIKHQSWMSQTHPQHLIQETTQAQSGLQCRLRELNHAFSQKPRGVQRA